MTHSEIAAPRSLGSSIRALSSKWGWFVALGALLTITGLIALATVVPATIVSVFWLGAIMIVAGMGETIAAFKFRDWGRFALWLVMGLMYITAGVICFVNPLVAATSLTLIIAIALIVSGGIRIWLGSQMKESGTWVAVAFSGVITALLGILILMQWPVSGLYVLGIFLGVDLLFAGIGWITTGLAIRRLTDGK